MRALRLDPGLLARFERRFVDELRRALGRRGARPVPGAVEIVARLTEAGHRVSFATGAWERSARAKLEAACIDIGELVLVGSDFDPSREEIIREAWRRSGASGRAVYVGDGVWDARAAPSLGLPFVGVDHERTGLLRRAGVSHVVEDYQDFPAFLDAVRLAAVP